MLTVRSPDLTWIWISDFFRSDLGHFCMWSKIWLSYAQFLGVRLLSKQLDWHSYFYSHLTSLYIRILPVIIIQCWLLPARQKETWRRTTREMGGQWRDENVWNLLGNLQINNCGSVQKNSHLYSFSVPPLSFCHLFNSHERAQALQNIGLSVHSALLTFKGIAGMQKGDAAAEREA